MKYMQFRYSLFLKTSLEYLKAVAACATLFTVIMSFFSLVLISDTSALAIDCRNFGQVSQRL